MRGRGHWDTGNLKVYIRGKNDLAKAKLLMERAYQEN